MPIRDAESITEDQDPPVSLWFVAVGVLTAAMMMWGFETPKITFFRSADCDLSQLALSA
jgi:hypothetical protein